MVLYRTEARLGADRNSPNDRLWRRMGLTSRLSSSLWVVIAVMGTVLTAVA